uniref:Uncharacterized protein n=1 Tax=Staphylothermus marinus TaxID=2280 RepID=A0A7C4D7G2_STAMA
MIFKKKKNPLREAIYAAYHVKNGISKLDILVDRIKTRRNRLLEIAAELEARGESFLAKKYASEVSKLDNICNRLLDIRLVLEKISLVLEYSINRRIFEETMREVYSLLTDLKKLPESTIPELGLTLVNIEYSIKNILDDYIELGFNIEYSPPSDENVNKILEEAKTILKNRLEADLSPETSSKV